MIDYEQLAKEAVGNWRSFESFGWHDKPDDANMWAIVYTHNRDSGLRELSNAAAIEKELAVHLMEENPDIISQHHGHWGVGWVDGYAIRVYNLAGLITSAFKAWCDLSACIEEHSVLDEHDLSEREYEAAINAISQNGSRLFEEEISINWESEVYGWLSRNKPSALENRDGNGAWPSQDSIQEALESLGLITKEY